MSTEAVSQLKNINSFVFSLFLKPNTHHKNVFKKNKKIKS